MSVVTLLDVPHGKQFARIDVRPDDELVPAEHSARPRRVIVHDPGLYGALSRLDSADDIEQTMLFQEAPDANRFSAQHRQLFQALSGAVDQVLYLDAILPEGSFDLTFDVNPNQVFTRDSAITLPWWPRHFLPCAMARPLRASEPAIMSAALLGLGMTPILSLPQGAVLEGGDVIPFSYEGKLCLMIGHGPRTNLRAIEHLAARLVPAWIDEIIAIDLGPWRTNLDGALLPIAERLAIAHPASLLAAHMIDREGVRQVDALHFLKSLGYRIIEVSYEESKRFQACNGFCADDDTVVMYDLCPRVAEEARLAGADVITVPGSELVKGAGGPRAMTLPLYG